MGLFELIASVAAEEKTLTVFNPDAGVVDALRERFADRNLAVESATTQAGPTNYAVLAHDEAFLAAVDVADVVASERGVDPEFTPETYDSVLDELDETIFTSYDTGRMLAATREIEDRAWRGAAGELHAGFQSLDRLKRQLDTYGYLADRGTLDVHVYVHAEDDAAVGDVDLPDGLNLHRTDATEIRDTWFVVYDGGGVDAAACALVAEERSPGSFYGFWTYDPETVGDARAHLRATYVRPDWDADPDRSAAADDR
ncbi:MAG: DICT sensory domain-containing protein [Haloplanus sp.]